jgi:sugar/nucleoside kinase (ribokinase family)
MIPLERLRTLLGRFPTLSIGLVGDLFLDRYLDIECGLEEYSIETGLEAYQVTQVRNVPGALGTVMNNLAALGVGRLVPVTVIGDDGHGYDLLRQLQELPVDTSHIAQSPQRLTPTYTKPMRQDADGGWRELHRLDVRTRSPLTVAEQDRLCVSLEQVFRATQGLIVLDQIDAQNQGVVNDAVRSCLQQLTADEPDKLIYVDSRSFLDRFRFGVLKGNESELRSLANGKLGVENATRKLAGETGHPVVCTLGEKGALVARPDGSIARIPGFPVAGPIDIVGAGDSATSGLVASMLAGADEVEAGLIGNLVASITVQQLGTTGTATPDQVVQRWHEVCK